MENAHSANQRMLVPSHNNDLCLIICCSPWIDQFGVVFCLDNAKGPTQARVSRICCEAVVSILVYLDSES